MIVKPRQSPQYKVNSPKPKLSALSITYCGGCGYEPRAEALAFAIGREFGIRVELHKTVGGLFEIDAGQERIFSKMMLGRFPHDGEIIDILKARYSAVNSKSADEIIREQLLNMGDRQKREGDSGQCQQTS